MHNALKVIFTDTNDKLTLKDCGFSFLFFAIQSFVSAARKQKVKIDKKVRTLKHADPALEICF